MGFRKLNDLRYIFQALRSKGVISDVMSQLKFDPSNGEHAPQSLVYSQQTQSMKPATHFIDKDAKLATKLTSYRGNTDIIIFYCDDILYIVLSFFRGSSSPLFFLFVGNIDPNRRYLYLQVLGGKAFLEHLQDSEPLPGHSSAATFTLHVCYKGQRFKSRPVPCACEPDIQEGFLLELHKDNAGNKY